MIEPPLPQLTSDAIESRWLAAASRPATDAVRALVVRTGGGAHATPDRVELVVDAGIVGDRWSAAASPDPDAQVSMMSLRVAEALVGGDPALFHVPGDNVVVDRDLDEASLPIGTRLRLGTAELVISPKPHHGCGKFKTRLGEDALRWIGDARYASCRLRGVYARVSASGVVVLGDRLQILGV